MIVKKVYIVGGDYSIRNMYEIRGWGVVFDPYEADLIQFTGGEDVDPSYYKEEKHATTYSNPKRDAREAHIFNSLKEMPMAGICRGGQFLNVMCGGEMWQNVDGHTRSHVLRMVKTGETYEVTSTHHQMMRPPDGADVLATANISTRRESATYKNTSTDFQDVEIVKYGNKLCFQPHPEYVHRDHECQELFFNLLKDIM